MKAVLISSFFDAQARGGAALSVRILVQGLVELGHDVTVITTHAGRELVKEKTNGVTVYRLRPCNLYWIGNKNHQPKWKKTLWQMIDTWNPCVFRLVRSIMETERPDVVHVNKLRGLSPSVWTAVRSSGHSPIVQTCRDYELMSPEGTLSGRVGAWARRGDWTLWPYQRIRGKCSQSVAAVTAPSRYTLNLLKGRGFFPHAVEQVIPNSHGLTLEELKQRESLCTTGNRSSETIRLLYLGRLEAIKGVDILCAAFERSAASYPHLRLGIAGWGTLETSLRQRYEGHKQITFHGPVFGEEKKRLLNTTDAVVVPSIWPEVFGVVIAEAYAYGKPAIATEAGGIPELVQDGITGWLVPSEDIDALAAALCRAAQSHTQIGAMATDCFRAARKYTRDTVVGHYLSLYGRLVEHTK